jgi:hypothetical protein
MYQLSISWDICYFAGYSIHKEFTLHLVLRLRGGSDMQIFVQAARHLAQVGALNSSNQFYCSTLIKNKIYEYVHLISLGSGHSES